MRLIDADALKDKCYITVRGTTIGRNNYVMFHEIDATPTIDAVQVVRCKDCKHWQNEHLCLAWSRHGTIETMPEQYCSYGERKDGEA